MFNMGISNNWGCVSGNEFQLTCLCKAQLQKHCITGCNVILSIPVAERSKTKVSGRSLAGIAGSNPAEGLDVCLL
jgi:hypothetical protein